MLAPAPEIIRTKDPRSGSPRFHDRSEPPSTSARRIREAASRWAGSRSVIIWNGSRPGRTGRCAIA